MNRVTYLLLSILALSLFGCAKDDEAFDAEGYSTEDSSARNGRGVAPTSQPTANDSARPPMEAADPREAADTGRDASERSTVERERSSSSSRGGSIKSSSGGPVRVKGYYRKDGTYVAPHTRSRPRR